MWLMERGPCGSVVLKIVYDVSCGLFRAPWASLSTVHRGLLILSHLIGVSAMNR